MKKHSLVGRIFLFAFICVVAVSAAEAKGKKFGLFVGINAYSDGINPLKGCVNDATKMQDAMVTKFGFNKADTTLLTDGAATRAAILAGLQKYQTLAGPGDLLVFHYSGHGTLFPDSYSEEKDETKQIFLQVPNDEGKMEVLYERGTYDSAIVPVDANSYSSGKAWGNLILDDELYAIFSAVTRKGAQVVLISDSCHSGSIDRATPDYQKREVPLVNVFGVRRYSDLKLKKPTKIRKRTLPPAKGLYISMTGSRDDEFSLDATIGGTPMGLFTAKLLENLPSSAALLKAMTYEGLMARVSTAVSSQASKWDSNQNPQLNFTYGNPKAPIFSVPGAR
jgi:hypothetical protein